MVEITVRWRRELECTEADIVKCLVINAERLVRILDKLVYRKGCVVRLNEGYKSLNHGYQTANQPRRQCQTLSD